MMKVLAIIPARSGSKGIPHKNVSICGGKLLIHWTMEAAKKSKRITRTITSTDSPVYRELLRRHGNDLFPFISANDLHVTSETSLGTPGGSGNLLLLELIRDYANDTDTDAAMFISLRLKYGRTV